MTMEAPSIIHLDTIVRAAHLPVFGPEHVPKTFSLQTPWIILQDSTSTNLLIIITFETVF